jgi:DivIVA domain-containing protein
MAEIERQSFEVVRRGYDIDQVDEFLVRQAEAWRNELFESRRRVSELESDLTRLAQLEVEVDQARRQQDALTMTLQTAAQARDEMLAKAEQDVAALRAECEQEVEQELAEAKAKAAQLLGDAEQESSDIRYQNRLRTDELVMAQEEQLKQRQAELDEAHDEAKGRYELAEQALATKIRDLNSMREALVTGLEAIASGGLAALEEVGDVLEGVGIVGNDDSAVHALLDSTGSSNGAIASPPPDEPPSSLALDDADGSAYGYAENGNGNANGSSDNPSEHSDDGTEALNGSN